MLSGPDKSARRILAFTISSGMMLSPLIALSSVGLDSPPGDREHCFFDLGDGIIADLVELKMRKVGHLVGCHDAIDNCRTVGLERPGELGMQLAGFRRPKPWPPQA